jgi:predicted restriction endonuclease
MSERIKWSRQQLLIAFNLYCQLPFGKMHSHNPEIKKYANLIGRTPSALAMKLTNIASLDPAITNTGRKGLSGASSTDKKMWEEMQDDWDKFANEAQLALQLLGTEDLEKEEQEDENIDYSGRDKTVTTTMRIGQGFFRKAVLSAYNNTCCITGLNIPNLLIASHIVPWRIDEKNRLNPRNGLCLSMLHDKAFDLGIITITESLTVKVSPKFLDFSEKYFRATFANYEGKKISLPEKFQPDINFLQYHKVNIFQE